MLVLLAWKNIWRNKVRSIVVILAVMFGLIGGVMSVGIMQGWISQRVKDAVNNEVSHVQVHSKKYLENDELKYIIPDLGKLTTVLDTASSVVAWSTRIKATSMIQSSWASSGLSLYGIDSEKEKQLTDIHTHLIAGNYLSKEASSPEIVISKKTAEALKLRNFTITTEKKEALLQKEVPESVFAKLLALEGKRFRTEKEFNKALKERLSQEEIKKYKTVILSVFEFYRLRSKVNVTTQSLAGDIAFGTFRIKGIFKTSNSGFDMQTAFVDKTALAKVLGIEKNDVHELAILMNSVDYVEGLADILKQQGEQNKVSIWTELRPDLAMTTDFVEVIYYFYIGIILFALAFGIINTMMMAVMERTHEIGMLMAVGMNKRRLFNMIMLETLYLSLTGAVLGMIIGSGLIRWSGHKGLNFGMWAEGFESMGYSAVVYPSVNFEFYVGVTLMVFFTGMIASIWPARRALKLNPAEAVRSDV